MKLVQKIITAARKWALPVGIGFVLLTAAVWFIALAVRPRTKLTFIADPGGGATIRLDEKLTFAASTEVLPPTCTFIIPSLPTNEYRATKNKNILTIQPTWHWPVKSRLVVTITCDGENHEFAFITPDEARLSLDEQVLIQAASDYEVGQATKQFEEDFPYASLFPLERENYVLLYVAQEDEVRIIMRENTPISEAEQQRLIQTERLRLSELGVPGSVKLIFGSK